MSSGRADIGVMARLRLAMCAAALLLGGSAAMAQFPMMLPGGQQPNPLPAPPSPPPPKIEVPVVPKFDAPAKPSYRPAAPPSFGDRITRCIEEGAAAGLSPSDREAYSRACAQR